MHHQQPGIPCPLTTRQEGTEANANRSCWGAGLANTSQQIPHPPGALTQQALGDQAKDNRHEEASRRLEELPRASQIYLLDHNHLIKETRRAVVIGDSFLRGTEGPTEPPDNP